MTSGNARKLALVVGNTRYEDARLSALVSPQADVTALAGVLRSPDIGQFDEVRTLVNEPERVARRELWTFFAAGDRRRDDVLLFYFSGHGVRDDHGQLYLAFPDTETDLLRASALPGTELREAMDRSRSRRQVVVLDCCHSGAFERGAKAVMGESVGTQSLFGDVSAFQAEGEGRVTLTATDSTQFAWEGSNLKGEADRSLFTQHLVEGLSTGRADLNGDGWVSVDELYDYVYSRVVSETPRQKPGKFGAVQGEFVIARRRPGSEEPVPLPPDIAEDLESIHRPARQDAVAFLAAWLRGNHIGRALAARAALGKVAEGDDSLTVRDLARTALEQRGDPIARSAEPEERRLVIPSVELPSGRSRRAQRRPRDVDRQPERAPEAVEPAGQEAASPATAMPGGGAEELWAAWALTVCGGDRARADAVVRAALATIARGGDAEAAAAAGRAEAARTEPVQATAGGAVGTRSADGRYVWDGYAWRLVSSDGWYYWSGAAWVDITSLA